MRVVTWNCNGAFRDKYDRVASFDDDYGDDILVIQESEAPELLPETLLDRYPNIVWVAHNRIKGLLVLASERYRIEIAPEYDETYRFVVPVAVSGEIEFTLIAIWSQKADELTYSDYVLEGLKRYERLIDEDTLVLGDFNSTPRVKSSGDTAGLVAWLAEHGLVSAYHHMMDEVFGQETLATYAHRRDLSERFHIDYVFASEKALNGSAAFKNIDAVDIEYSDHVPLFVNPAITRADK